MIAALYVEPGGPYYDRQGVEPWGLPARDARDYAGPYPVVAHPPCKRWGRYWSGGPSAKVRRDLGDDDGCFAAAFCSVKRWGGVLEHPEARKATWLWAVGVGDLPELSWGKAEGKTLLDEGFHSAEERRRLIKTGVCQRLSKRQRLLTPPAFADLLLTLAGGVRS